MITDNDHRHGSRAGYIAGCRRTCCTEPNFRYQKRSKIRLQREGTQIVSACDVLERAQWWLDRGVTAQGLTDAAGLGYGTLAELLKGERDVCLKSTAAAILALGWDDLLDRSHCSADLTKRRIYSMMAAGHTLAWICEETGDRLATSGRWRNQARVTLATARTVMRVYDAAPLQGPSKSTAVRARNRGHLHPLEWDDPGVPAMHSGWSPEVEHTPRRGPGRIPLIPALVEDFEFLRSCGESDESAAARLGIERLDSFTDQRRKYLKARGEVA